MNVYKSMIDTCNIRNK